MTRLEDRQTLMRDIAQACAEGARLAPACALAGIAARTLQRWKIDGLTRGDRRPDAARPVPSHALSEAERARIIEVANEPRFAATPAARITAPSKHGKVDSRLCDVFGDTRSVSTICRCSMQLRWCANPSEVCIELYRPPPNSSPSPWLFAVCRARQIMCGFRPVGFRGLPVCL